MSEPDVAPRAVAAVPLLRRRCCRRNGFAISPDQTTSFLAAIGLLGPREPEDIRQAGLATLAPPPERHAAYNLLFRIHFLGEDPPPVMDAESEEPRQGAGRPARRGRGARSRRDERIGRGRDARRGARGAPLRPRGDGGRAAASRARGRAAPAAPAQLSPHARPARRRRRPAPHLTRRRAQRRRGDPSRRGSSGSSGRARSCC